MALRGIRVLEFAGLAPGPMAGLMLRDFGADVIRVDRAGAKAEGVVVDWMSAGKRSIAVNMKQAEGVGIVRQLAEKVGVHCISLTLPQCSRSAAHSIAALPVNCTSSVYKSCL